MCFDNTIYILIPCMISAMHIIQINKAATTIITHPRKIDDSQSITANVPSTKQLSLSPPIEWMSKALLIYTTGFKRAPYRAGGASS